jgi:hypothetical protein
MPTPTRAFGCLIRFFHRYAFRSTEKVALQEIGPRFTLKLQWLKKGIPTTRSSSDKPIPLELNLDAGGASVEKSEDENKETTSRPILPLKDEEFLWVRKVSISFRYFVRCVISPSCSLN